MLKNESRIANLVVKSITFIYCQTNDKLLLDIQSNLILWWQSKIKSIPKYPFEIGWALVKNIR